MNWVPGSALSSFTRYFIESSQPLQEIRTIITLVFSDEKLRCRLQSQRSHNWLARWKRPGPGCSSPRGLRRRQGQFNTDPPLCEERERRKAQGGTVSPPAKRTHSRPQLGGLPRERHPGASDVTLQNPPGVSRLECWFLFQGHCSAGPLSASHFLSQDLRVFHRETIGWIITRGAVWC